MRSSVFCPGHFQFQSSPVKWIYQTADFTHPNIFIICLYFFLFFSPRMDCFPFISAHVIGPQEQLPNTNATPGIDSRPFTCLTDDEFMRNGPCTVATETAFKPVFQSLLVPWKRYLYTSKITVASQPFLKFGDEYHQVTVERHSVSHSQVTSIILIVETWACRWAMEAYHA